MIKVFTTNAVISKGYNGAPAIKFSDTGDSARFRIGKKVYDTRAENNTRWLNLTVKVLDAKLCERIRKMQLKEGSFVNIIGKLDEDAWTDNETKEEKKQMVIILDELEYASNGGGKPNNNQGGNNQAAPAQNGSEPPASDPTNSDNFTGFEPMGDGNMFDVG